MIVYTDMVGDLFHFGHVRLMKKIKDVYPGCTLIVGVHHDSVVSDYKRIPILNMAERIEVIESCKYIDKVIKNAPLIINESYIKEHNIDIVIHAHLFEENERYNKMYEVPSKLGIFVQMEPTKGISTTQIIKRIIDRKDDF